MLALMTGMRRGELLALKWQDVNFAESTLYVRRACIEVTGRGIIETEPKTAKRRRSIHLPPLAIQCPEETSSTSGRGTTASGDLAGTRLDFLHVAWYTFHCNVRTWSVQGTVEEGECAGYPVSRFAAQCGDTPSWHGHSSQSRAGAIGSQPDQHDDGHLLACDAQHAEGRDDEAKRGA